MTDPADRDYEKYSEPRSIWDEDQWKGFAFTEVPTKDGPYWELGMVFGDREYGRKVFEAVSGWNDHKQEDRKNNICISFIIQNEREYLTYVYPGLPDVPPDRLIDTIIICKTFPNPPTSHFRKFQAAYKGDPYLLGAHYTTGDAIDRRRKLSCCNIFRNTEQRGCRAAAARASAISVTRLRSQSGSPGSVLRSSG